MLVNLECPVELLNYRLYRSKSTEKIFCSLTFNNLSDKGIRGLKVNIYCYDQFDDTIGEIESKIIFKEIETSQGPFHTEEKLELINLSNVEKIEIEINKVIFEDKTSWEKNDTQLEEVNPTEIKDPKLLSFVNEIEGVDAKYYAQNIKNKWICVCGRLNYKGMDSCRRCERDQEEILIRYSSEEKINQQIELHEKEQKELEKRKQEIIKAKISSIGKYGSISIALLIIIGVAIFGFMTKATFSMENYQLLKDKDNALIESVKAEDTKDIEFLIKNQANVNYQNVDSEFPLGEAIKTSNKEVIQQLISAGALIDDIGKAKDTALHLAVASNQLEVLKYFVQQKYDVNIKNKNEESIIYTALENGNEDIIDYLLTETKINLNNIDQEGNNAIQAFLTIIQQNPQLDKNILDKLLESNIDLKTINNTNHNSYYTAIILGNQEDIEKMMDYGMELNNIDEEGNNAIHILFRDRKKDKEQLLAYFIEEGADVNAFNKAGQSPLYIAISNGSLPDVQALIKYKADIEKIDEEGNTALAVAKEKSPEIESYFNQQIEKAQKEQEKRRIEAEKNRLLEEEQLKTEANKESVERNKETQDNNDKVIEEIVINYHIDESGIASITPDIDKLSIKVNQKIILNPTFSNEAYERVLIDGSLMKFIDPQTIQATQTGVGTLTIIPYSYDWDNAKEYTVNIE